jgi:hypothetical protein
MTLDEAYDLAVQSTKPVLLLAEEQGTFGTPGKNYIWYPWISIQGLGPYCLFYMNLLCPPTSTDGPEDLSIKYLNALTIIGRIAVCGKDAPHVKLDTVAVRGQPRAREPLFSAVSDEGDLPLKITFYSTTWTANAGQLAISSLNNGGTLTYDMDRNSYSGVHDGYTNLISVKQTSGTTNISNSLSTFEFPDIPGLKANEETPRGSALYYEVKGGVMNRLVNTRTVVCGGSANATTKKVSGDGVFHNNLSDPSATVGTGSEAITDLSDSAQLIEKVTNSTIKNSAPSSTPLINLIAKGNATYRQEKSGVTLNGHVNDTEMVKNVLSDSASLTVSATKCCFINQGNGTNILNKVGDGSTMTVTAVEEDNSNPNSEATLLNQENRGGNLSLYMSNADYSSTMDGVSNRLLQPREFASSQTSETWTNSSFVGRIARQVGAGNVEITGSGNHAMALSEEPLEKHTVTDSGSIRWQSENFTGKNLGAGEVVRCMATDEASFHSTINKARFESSSDLLPPIVNAATGTASMETSYGALQSASPDGAVLSHTISDQVKSTMNVDVTNKSTKGGLAEVAKSIIDVNDTSMAPATYRVGGTLTAAGSTTAPPVVKMTVCPPLPTTTSKTSTPVLPAAKSVAVPATVTTDPLSPESTVTAVAVEVDGVDSFDLDYSGATINVSNPGCVGIMESIKNVPIYSRIVKGVKVNAGERGIMRTVENASGITTASGNSWRQSQSSLYPLVEQLFHDKAEEILMTEGNMFMGQSESECCRTCLFGSANVNKTRSNCVLKNTSQNGGFTYKRECSDTSKLVENANGNTYHANKIDFTSQDPVALKLICMNQAFHMRNNTGNSIFTDGGSVHNSTMDDSTSINQPTGTMVFNPSPATTSLIKTESTGRSNYVSNPVGQIINAVNLNTIFERSAKEESKSTVTASSQIINNTDPFGQSFVNTTNVQESGNCTNTMSSTLVSSSGHGDSINNDGAGTCTHANNGVICALGGTLTTSNTTGSSTTTSINSNVTATTEGQLCNATCSDDSIFLKRDITSALTSHVSDKSAYQVESNSTNKVTIQQNVASLQQMGGEDCDVSLFNLCSFGKAIESDVANTTFTTNTKNAIQELTNVDALHINSQMLNAIGDAIHTTDSSYRSNTFNAQVGGKMMESDPISDVGLVNGNASAQVLIERVPADPGAVNAQGEVKKKMVSGKELTGSTAVSGITGFFGIAATRNCPLLVSGTNNVLFGQSTAEGSSLVVDLPATFTATPP